MPVIIDGTNGISGVDGTAASPALEGTDTNTGVFFPAADTVAIATNGTEKMRIDSSGRLGLNQTNVSGSTAIINSPDGYSDVNTGPYTSNFTVFAPANSYGGFDIQSFGGAVSGGTYTANQYGGLYIRRTRGTITSKLGTQSSDVIGNIAFQGWNATSSTWMTLGAIAVQQTGAPGSIAASSILNFATNDGTTGSVERLRIDSSGNVLVVNPAGLGYGTGAGGTVTQATSKSTTVTLNKPTGLITMSNAALAGGATVAFQLNNSLVTINDTILISFNASLSGVNGNYSWRAACGSGAVYISVKNESGASLSEAVPLNFTIIKGATA